MNRVLLLLLLLSFNLIKAQDNFGQIRLKKVDELNQKSTDQSIFNSELKPVGGTEFRLIKTETDKLGMRHRTYQQYYNGIKVHFGILKMHERNGVRETFGGAYFNPNEVRTSPSIPISSIKNIAQTYMRGNDVFWIGENDISKTVIPEPELLILPNRRKKTMHLVYAIGIGASKPELKMGIVYVDAQSGEVLKFKNQVYNCFDSSDESHDPTNHDHKLEDDLARPFVSGTAATVYSGSQTIETTLDTDYILYDQTRANTGQGHNHGAGTRNGVVTVNFNNHDDVNDYNSAFVSDFTDNDNNWTAGEMSANEDQYALDAHWGAQVVYDYWKNEHSRDSYDAADAAIVSYVHFDTNYTNAAWLSFNSQRGFMIYGDGAGSFTPLTNLDVVGHEIGHGVTNANSNLDYELESGALNEGMSDIWAAAIDTYATANHGTTKNAWLINDENGGGVIRSMSNPNAYGQPDTYGGTYWYDVAGCTPNGTNNDYCGIHTNSGVLNYWFYLLVNGGSGTNDIGNAFSVSGLGIDKAAAIAYRMESIYLTSTSDYAAARDAAIQASQDLYGFCSPEEESVTNAFYAVGVGTVYSSQTPSITTDTSNQTVCTDQTATFFAEADYANTMIWQNDASGSWADLSDDSTYAGVTTNSLTITNPSETLDGVRFRLEFSNDCGTESTTNNRYLYVDTLPNVTSIVSNGAGCSSTTDGSLIVNFDDVSGMTSLEFSIDGGASYPYNYDDTTSSQTISGLAAGDYDVWVRRGNNDCPRQLGIYTITSVPTVTATVDAIIEADIAEIDGIIQVSFNDEPTQTNVKFSIDGGVSYAFVFNDSLGTGELTGLAADTYDVWVAFGDESCAKSLGSFTVNEMAYTQIPDTNFENALNNLTYDNYLGDNKVPTALINTATSLNVRLENITDLTGIEAFTALEDLYVDNNNLTTLDVSSNMALKQLIAYNNANLSSFTVANPSIITRVTLSGCNLSGDYDFSGYTALVNFSVQNNDLTDLNIQNGNNTNFTYFDARGNSNLTCILVDDAVWSTTNWTNDGGATFSSTFCDYTLIPDANFEAALEALGYDDISSDGQVPTSLIEVLTSLDVSNEGIANLTGIQDFVALESLKLNNNSLTSLDVSNLINLKTLWAASGNVFSTIDVSNNTLLEDFRLRQYSGTTVDLSANTALTRFNCTSCDFLTVDTSSNTNLVNLDLWDSKITSLDLSLNSNLEVLDVYSTNLTALDLSNNTSLTNLIANDITTLSSLNIQNGTNTSITGFNTSGTPVNCILVDDPAWSALNWTNIDAASNFSLYCGNYTLIPDANFETALRTLGYDDSATNDGQVPTALIEVVTSLDVNTQSIADLTGIQDFTALIDLNLNGNTLTSLDVSNNVNLEIINFDNNDVATLNLGANTNLTDVSGRYNQLTSVDVSANIALDNLNLRNNTFTTVDVANNTNLTVLNLNQTGITSLDITNNTSLSHVYLLDNSLTSLDISQNPLIENINLTNNDLTTIDLSNQTVLRILRLSGNNLTTLNLNTNVALTQVECADNDLISFNFKNGFNQIITDFDASGNANLSCILIDDLNKDYTFWIKDTTTSFSDTYCRYTAIPDANFEAALEALGYDDISADGQVPTALIEVVTSLDVRNENISAITGIEDFAALVDLDISDNSILTIDISNNLLLEKLFYENNGLASIDVSQNTALKELDLDENTLTTLDVSQNTALTLLDLSDNELTSLDVTNNTALTFLAFERNNVSGSIDLSSHTQLTILAFEDNDLTGLNVKNGNNTNVTYYNSSGNSSLSCIVVDDLANDYSTWTKDVTTNFSDTYCRYTATPDVNFEAALEALGYDDITADGQVPTVLIEVVTSLGVSSKSIADLTGIEDFTALTNLNCSSNILTALNITSNTALESLNFSKNSIASIDVSNNVALEQIFAFENSLITIDVSQNTDLVDLDIDTNFLTSLDISANTVLETLDVINNSLVEIDVSNNLQLWAVYLSYNTIANIDFSNHTLLEDLECVDCELTYLNVQNGNNTNVTTFRVNNNPDLTCILVDDATYSTTNWTDIDSGVTFNDGTYCRYTAIPDTNFEAELEAQGYDDISGDGQVPTQLIEVIETLNVESKGIADLTGIEDFRALKSLDVGYNSLSTIDVTNNIELRQLIIRSNNLTTIDLSANTLLVGFKAENCSLTSLDITNNLDLKVLWLSGNDLTAIDLSNNVALTSFWGSGNDFVTLDLTNNPALNSFRASSNSLASLNLKNGTNTNITGGTNFQLTGNADLACVLVDDAAYSTTNWLIIDGNVNFSDTDCDYTLIPDANFEARLEALGYDDASADGRVPTRLIEVVTNLNVSNQSIADLTGIEDFTALEVLLSTNNNSLTSIDLSNNLNLLSLSAFNCGLTSLGVTNNTSLQSLKVYGNSITNIDVSLNTQLIDLDLAANDLTALDLANNVLLQTLFVEDNNISNLDLSSNIALLELTCQNNSNLSFLNVNNGNNTNVTNFAANNNPSLSCILVDDLSNDYSTWTKDASTSFSDTYCRYTLIPDANFEAELRLLGYDDSTTNDGKVPTALIEVVTDLDVRNKSISDITGIEDFIALQTFNCNLNNIAALDVSNNVNLTALQCTANPITILNLANNTQLEELNCRSTDITTLDLTNNTLLKRLICFDTDIVTLDLSQNLLLEDLYSYNTNLSTLDLSLNTALEIIHVYNNELENLTIKNGNNNNVTNFNALGNTNLACILVDDLANDYSGWTKDATAIFSDTYCRYTAIPDTNFEAWLGTLGYDDINNDGLVPTALIEVVTNLNATSQDIASLTGIEDFVALENLYVGDNALTSLNLSTNLNLKILDITDNANLTTINITSNTVLEELFASNSGLTVVDFSNNVLLKILTIFNNNLVALDLSNNVNLESVLCQNNDIVDLDLSLNSVLTYIDVSNNLLTSLNSKNGNNINFTVFNALNNPSLTCILVDDALWSTNNWTSNVDGTASFNDVSCDVIYLSPKVMLQGAILNPNIGEESLMRDDLRLTNYIPTESPYVDNLTCNTSVFTVTGSDAIVDWIWVELRDKNDNTSVLYSQSALLQRDGDVVDVDGTSALSFSASEDNYYVTIKHRNHLGIMSSNVIALSKSVTTVDFTDANNQITYGTDAQTTFNMPSGVVAMWAGDANGDGKLNYSGGESDVPNIRSQVFNDPDNSVFGGPPVASYQSAGYNTTDIDMDGVTVYSGGTSDVLHIRNNIFNNPSNSVFGGPPTSTYLFIQQLPEGGN
ncbi:M4 family metallopeptidase [uncultured Lacinutrix sp.]|uniref:M4 family metallopeptidase n=1 Tax=uncultured Lacinutrix sp. TaxID=574032 RepID=UPI0026161ADC|nr:M4 family metallopeptidase [uncultured Lacinutrix sp.]